MRYLTFSNLTVPNNFFFRNKWLTKRERQEIKKTPFTVLEKIISQIISQNCWKIGSKPKLVWLIWAVYNNSFLNISESKMENRPENKGPRKSLLSRVFYILFCILFPDCLGNEKHAATWSFTWLPVILRGRECTFLIYSLFSFIHVRNDFKQLKRGRVFSLLLKIQLFSKNLKSLMFFSKNLVEFS